MTFPPQPSPSAPTPSDQPSASPQAQPPTGLYETPRAALQSIREDYSYWSGKLTESSFALSLAVIGANWAVFGSVDRIRSNLWSEISLSVVLFSLVVTLFGHWKLGGMLRKRVKYAERDPGRWQKEFTETFGKETPWPFTAAIDRWAVGLRAAKTWLPIFGGAFFLLALFGSPHPQSPVPVDGSWADYHVHFWRDQNHAAARRYLHERGEHVYRPRGLQDDEN